MAYNVTSSTHRTSNTLSSRVEPQQHIYEEQPYYANERPISRQSYGGDSRRSVGVSDQSFLVVKYVKLHM